MEKELGTGKNRKGLNDKQRRIIPFIIGAKDVENGCKAAGVSTVAYYSWLRDSPEFADAIATARNELIADSMQRLRQGISKAIDKLLLLVDSQNEEVSRKASTSIVEMALRLREDEEITERIESIEKIVLERRSYR
jgi:hypothetical protein